MKPRTDAQITAQLYGLAGCFVGKHKRVSTGDGCYWCGKVALRREIDVKGDYIGACRDHFELLRTVQWRRGAKFEGREAELTRRAIRNGKAQLAHLRAMHTKRFGG